MVRKYIRCKSCGGLLKVKRQETKKKVKKETKKKVVIPIRKSGSLSAVGYKDIKNLPKWQRQLIRAVRTRAIDLGGKKGQGLLMLNTSNVKPSALAVFRRLIARATQHKNKNPQVSAIMREDAYFIKKYYL